MISTIELSAAFIGTIIIQIISYTLLRVGRGSKKPKGSISEDINLASATGRMTGNLIFWVIAILGLGNYFAIVVRLIGYCLNNSWESSNLYHQAIQFPIWVNYTGILLLLLSGVLKGSIMAYNINFTPFCFPMKKGYTLSTGGPYRFVRHPIYLLHGLWALSLFFMTGIQVLLISLICYLIYFPQAYYEEKALKKIYGDRYEQYASKTGMFLPKWFKT